MAEVSMGDGFWHGPGPEIPSLEALNLQITDNDYILFGDLSGGDAAMGWDGTNLTLKPGADDTGAFIIGDGTTDMDVKVFLGTTSQYVLFDVGNVLLQLEAVDLKLGDADILQFGDAAGGDVNINWTGTLLQVSPAADDTGSINIGDGTADIDVKVFLGATTQFVLFDVGGALLTLEDVDLHLGDNDRLEFGDATGGDVSVIWNGTNLVASAAANAMWANCPSLLDPNYTAIAYHLIDDFFHFDDTATVGNWISTHDSTGDVALVDDVAGGRITITCAATSDDDGNQIRGTSAPFFLAAGKHLWFEAKVTMAEATQSDMQIGLVAAGEDLTGVADNYAADGILFTKDDGATTIKFTASKAGTDTGQNTDVGTLDTSAHTYGFYVNGVTDITPYFDGVADTAITATLPDDQSLTPLFGVRNGDATITNIMTIDYVKVVQLR